MSPRNCELAEWKLSAAIGLIRYAAEDVEKSLDSKELWGLCEMLNEARQLIKTGEALTQ